jgi:hypothetical protein
MAVATTTAGVTCATVAYSIHLAALRRDEGKRGRGKGTEREREPASEKKERKGRKRRKTY